MQASNQLQHIASAPYFSLASCFQPSYSAQRLSINPTKPAPPSTMSSSAMPGWTGRLWSSQIYNLSQNYRSLCSQPMYSLNLEQQASFFVSTLHPQLPSGTVVAKATPIKLTPRLQSPQTPPMVCRRLGLRPLTVPEGDAEHLISQARLQRPVPERPNNADPRFLTDARRPSTLCVRSEQASDMANAAYFQ